MRGHATVRWCLTGALAAGCGGGEAVDATTDDRGEEETTGVVMTLGWPYPESTSETEADATEPVHPTGETRPSGPSCEDGARNQDETDVDCGGATCAGCAEGSLCLVDEDCEVASCVGLVCAAPTCSDGVRNAAEADIDCGGACGGCGDGFACAAGADCASGVCTGGTCTPAACGDGVANGEESDVDCGGTRCPGCPSKAACATDDDCASGMCASGKCKAVECLIDMQCAGLDTTCAAWTCDPMSLTCKATAMHAGEPCDDGDVCTQGTVCGAEGACGGGSPLDCSGLADACHVATCEPDAGCASVALTDGFACEDGAACTSLETCSAGVCGGATQALLVEDFAGDAGGWTLGTQWEIGAAEASTGCVGGQDPAADRSPSDDNRMAGVAIGGCIPDATAHAVYCLTSPVVDTSAAPADVHLSYWRVLHGDHAPYMRSSVEVFDGGDWVPVYETATAAVHDAAWTFVTHEVSAYKHAGFQARWCFEVGMTSSPVFLVAGWSVDDVTIGPAACEP